MLHFVFVLALALGQDENPLQKFSAEIDAVPDKGGKGVTDRSAREVKDALRACIRDAFKDPKKPNLHALRLANYKVQSAVNDIHGFAEDERSTKLMAVWESMVQASHPLERFRAAIAAVKTDSGNAEADGKVKKVKDLLTKWIDTGFKEPLWPDWPAILANGKEIKTVMDDDSFKSDARHAELQKIRGEVADVINGAYGVESAAFKKGRNIDHIVQAYKYAKSYITTYSEDRFCLMVVLLELALRDLKYVATVYADYKSLVIEKKKSGDLTLGQAEEEAGAMLKQVRERLAKESAAMAAKSRGRVEEVYKRNHPDALKWIESAKKNAGGSDEEILRKHSDWESARNRLRTIVATFERELRVVPALKDETIDGKKASEILEGAKKMLEEAEAEVKAIRPKIDAIAKARHEAWVKTLTGDKKKLYEQKGGPSVRSKDDSKWHYIYHSGETWTVIYTFDGDKLLGERKVNGEEYP